MNQRRLGKLETLCSVSRQSEVRVLVDSAGDQAGYRACLLFVVAKDMGERRGEGCCALNTGKVNLANVGANNCQLLVSFLTFCNICWHKVDIPAVKAKNSLGSVVCDSL